MNIDLRNFVKVNLNYHENFQSEAKYDTAVLMLHSDESVQEINVVVKSLKEFSEIAGLPVQLNNYGKLFFANRGKKLHVIYGHSDTSDTAWYKEKVKALPMTEIAICLAESEADTRRIIDALNTEMITVATSETQEKLYSNINEKMFIHCLDSETIVDSYSASLTDGNLYVKRSDSSLVIADSNTSSLKLLDVNKYHNYILKVGSAGIEMTIAAYMTNLKLDSSKTLLDYCFTAEHEIDVADILDDNDAFNNFRAANVNLEMSLVNEVRNIGGNTVNGFDLMNYYIKIVLTQTLTSRIARTLAQKIKYNKTGLDIVANAITSEMNTYRLNGYLDTNYIWTDDDLYYTHGNQEYLVCEKNTRLSLGYKFIILPLSSLSPEDKANHRFPLIYLLVADSYSIRQIIIEGDIYNA